MARSGYILLDNTQKNDIDRDLNELLSTKSLIMEL